MEAERKSSTGGKMNISTEEMIDRLMKFCKRNDLAIKTLSVRAEYDGFVIDLEVLEGD